MNIIGITGQARAGKDSIGDYLMYMTEARFIRLSFAAPLKRMVATLLNRDEDWINEHKEDHIDGLASPRRLLQTLGTDWGRSMIDPNIWVNLVNRELNERLLSESLEGVVLTDCRFNNEADWIHGNGGEVWQVIRPDAPEVNSHVSEAGIDPERVDRIILNDGSLEDLYLKIEEIIGC